MSPERVARRPDGEPRKAVRLKTAILTMATGCRERSSSTLTGVGPGLNSFGFMARATLELTDGGRARFFAVFRQLFDGVDQVTTLADKVELK